MFIWTYSKTVFPSRHNSFFHPRQIPKLIVMVTAAPTFSCLFTVSCSANVLSIPHSWFCLLTKTCHLTPANKLSILTCLPQLIIRPILQSNQLPIHNKLQYSCQSVFANLLLQWSSLYSILSFCVLTMPFAWGEIMPFDHINAVFISHLFRILSLQKFWICDPVLQIFPLFEQPLKNN